MGEPEEEGVTEVDRVSVAMGEAVGVPVAEKLCVALGQAVVLGEEETVLRPPVGEKGAELVGEREKDWLPVTVPLLPPPPSPLLGLALALKVLLALPVTSGMVGDTSAVGDTSGVEEAVEDRLAVRVGVSLTVALRVKVEGAEKDTEVVMAASPVGVSRLEGVAVRLGSRPVPVALTLAVAVGVPAGLALLPPPPPAVALATLGLGEGDWLVLTEAEAGAVAVKERVPVPVWLGEPGAVALTLAVAVAVAVALAVAVEVAVREGVPLSVGTPPVEQGVALTLLVVLGGVVPDTDRVELPLCEVLGGSVAVAEGEPVAEFPPALPPTPRAREGEAVLVAEELRHTVALAVAAADSVAVLLGVSSPRL